MAYTPKFGRLPKDDEPINSASDEADRSIHEVERDNERYYQEQMEMAKRISRIQSGVRAGAAATLKRRGGKSETSEEQHGKKDKNHENIDILIGEKVQNELYKAVEGNDIYEPERGDNKNLEGSLSTEYMKAGFWKKKGMKGRRMVRAAMASLGANNMVEAEVAKRFGPQYKEGVIGGKKMPYETNVPMTIAERKRFVLERLRKEFQELKNEELLSIAASFNVDAAEIRKNLQVGGDYRTKIITGIFNRLASFDSKTLKKLNLNSSAFKDLILITDIEQRESAKIGVEEVYNAEKLHDFWNRIRFNTGIAVEVKNVNKVPKKKIRDIEEEIEVDEEVPSVENTVGGGLKISNDKQNAENNGKKVKQFDQPEAEEFLEKETTSDIDWPSYEKDKVSAADGEFKAVDGEEIPDLEPFPPLNLSKKPGRNRYSRSNVGDFLISNPEIAKERLDDKDILENHDKTEYHPKTRKVKKKIIRQEEYEELIDQEENKLISLNPLKELGETFENIIKSNSLWPLDKNPEGKVLMAEFQHRLSTIKFDLTRYKYYRDLLVSNLKLDEMKDDQRIKAIAGIEKLALEFARADALNLELKEIDKEISKKVVESEEEKRKEINKLQKEIYEDYKRLEGAYTNMYGRGKDLADAKISESRAKTVSDSATLEDKKRAEIALIEATRTKTDLLKKFEEGYKELRKIEGKFSENMMNLRNALNELKTDSYKDIEIIDQVLNSEPTNKKDLELPPDKAPENSLYAILKPHNENSWIKIQLKVDEIQGEINKFTPFQLLQRMLRREYLENRNPEHDPKHFHERAARYSLLTAAMRVQDAKNLDLHRNVNKKVAEYLKQYKIEKVYGKAASGMNLMGRKIGIELVEGDKETAASLIEQIIQSDAKFEVFRGITKYTTPRDLRMMLYQNGKEVSLETMEEFIAILENILQGVKKGDDKYLKTLMHGDWDLESLVLTLQKFKLEKWTQKYIDKTVASEGNREKVLLELLREKREEDEKINKEIHENVKSSDAMWKRQLSKNAIKDTLNEKILVSNEQIKGVGIENLKRQIAVLEEEIKDLNDGNANKVLKQREIESLKNQISRTERELTQSRDLYDKVQAFKETLEKDNLSRKQAKALAAEMGLGQIYDKMGMNFRLERYWKKTKARLKTAAEWSWDKTKKAWNWSKAKFLNKDTARKAFSLGRAGITPITYPAGVAWKVGTFPVRLAGRAMVGAASLPGRIWRYIYSPSMKSYLRDFPFDINVKKERLGRRKAALEADLAKAPYTRDKKRIFREINRINEQIDELDAELTKAKTKATELGITI